MTASHSDRQPARRISDVNELMRIARGLRRDVISLVAPTGQGYVQQGLGAADLFAVLFFAELRIDPGDPDWIERDRFILSTAHNTALFYAALAARGMVDAQAVKDYCKDGSPFEINASERIGPVVEATCGSLGQGLSVGVGMAIAARRRRLSSRVYVVLGDGELQEGQVWEAALFAGNRDLSNLCLLVDDNRMQVEGHVDRVLPAYPIAEKFRAFGWVVDDVDGHDVAALLSRLQSARSASGRPTCLVVRTIPGKGVPALEGLMAHNLKLPIDVADSALAALAGPEEQS